MLDEIIFYTFELKQMLIVLGYALPPVTIMYNNKLQQLNLDFKQMSDIISKKKSETLYENIHNVYFELMSTYKIIESLEDVHDASKTMYNYVKSY
jgi:hypothetical protein